MRFTKKQRALWREKCRRCSIKRGRRVHPRDYYILVILKYGGPRLYRSLRSFFLGLIQSIRPAGR